MKNIFAILSYGIPKDIFHDDNYQTYLTIVFNTIFAQAANQEATIITTGGKMDCVQAPYNRIEAQVVAEYFQSLMDRELVKIATKKWKIVQEKKSLSTLENLVFIRNLLKKKNISFSLTLFCEFTRKRRIRTIAPLIFGKKQKLFIHSVDFDTSTNRYVSEKELRLKEMQEIKFSQWALQSPQHFRKHHLFFEEKVNFLREQDQRGVLHTEAVHRWWKRASDLAQELRLFV